MGLDNINKKAIEPYRKRKKLLDLGILEKAYHVKRSYVLGAILIIVLFMLNRKYFLYGALTLFSFIFSFYHSKYNRTPIDFKMALFLGLYITRNYGLLLTMLFFFLTDIIPAILGGESVSGPDLFFFAWYFIVNSIVLLFPGVPMSQLGPALVIVESVGSIYINSQIAGIPGFLSIWIQMINILARIVYFLTLGNFLEFLFMAI